NRLRRLVATATLALGAVPALAVAQQPLTISGHVLSDAETPVQGVSVTIPAIAGVGAVTDAQGHYTFTVPASRVTAATATITARRIGFEPRSATIRLAGTQLTQDFILTATPTELTGVVVTALGLEK